jgi:glycerol kinase
MPSNDFSFYLDFGATHTKALVQSASNQKTFSFLERAPNLNKIKNKRSYSPTEYSSHAVKIFTSLVKKFGIPKNIAVSGQMATYIIVDKNSEPITPIISWQDTSSLDGKNHDGIDIYTYAKNIIEIREDGFRPGLPSVSLMSYLAEQKYALNQKYFYIPLTNFVLGSILEADLTKLNVHVSEAHCSGLFSLREKDWAIRGEQREILKNLSYQK